MLDGAPTDHFDPVFAKIVEELDGSGGLQPLRRLEVDPGNRTVG
jgi:hypothetical protein